MKRILEAYTGEPTEEELKELDAKYNPELYYDACEKCGVTDKLTGDLPSADNLDNGHLDWVYFDDETLEGFHVSYELNPNTWLRNAQTGEETPIFDLVFTSRCHVKED